MKLTILSFLFFFSLVTALAIFAQDHGTLETAPITYPTISRAVNTGSTSEADSSAFTWQSDCGGLVAEIYDNGWRVASCIELANRLSGLRDIRNVGVIAKPNVADMLTYSQYGSHFQVESVDFEQAKRHCRSILADGYAHPDIISQCRRTVAGVVPYGLKLRGQQ